MHRHLLAALCAVACSLAAATSAVAAPEPQGYRANDFSGGGVRDINPPGTNGTAGPLDLGAFLTTGARPRHNDDQLQAYGQLARQAPGLDQAGVERGFKDASFGIRPGEEESRESPRPDVTIVRDRAHGVPKVYGETRAGVMFGAGWIAAQDRLFFIDVLRNVGRGQLSSFAGGSPGNRAFEAEQWANAPYTEEDLQEQIEQFDDLYGDEGRQLRADLDQYIAGINAYISRLRLDPLRIPAEYVATNHPEGPQPWKPTDVVAIASLVGGIFGKGGGRELDNAQLLQSFERRFGRGDGRRLWSQLAAFDDADAPTTIDRGNGRFPYQTPPSRKAPGGEVLPTPGTVVGQPLVVAGPDAASSRRATRRRGTLSTPGRPRGAADPRGLLAAPQGQSNAMLIAGRRTTTGRPIAVFGPQVGYFAPQILMEQELHGGGIEARGTAFAGTNLYVQLGRGVDYSWSATSAGQDIIDTFAPTLCEPDGSAPTLRSMHYEYRGACRPIEVLRRTNSWQPSAADPTPAGTQTMEAQRTDLGIVRGRGMYKGRPRIFTALRSTYRHEVDSAIGFSRFNQPSQVRDAASFREAALRIGYTFNWFYADDRDITYVNSGEEPVRRKGTTGQLPMSPGKEWVDWNPDTHRARFRPNAAHPTVTNQEVITSWNNRQAEGFAGADTNLFSKVFRSEMLDRQIDRLLNNGDRKASVPEAVDAMLIAGTIDLRGQKALPLALRVLADSRDPEVRAAAARLRAWGSTEWRRIDRDGDGRYEHAEAIRIMDAWWPRWVRAQFAPTLGDGLYTELERFHQIDNTPNNGGQHLGSAYQTGWYGYVNKDLRRILRFPTRAPYARTFCGGGSRTACRELLERTLLEAVRAPAAEVYPRDAICSQPRNQQMDAQACADAISFRPIGGITQPLVPWQNRPTHQQVVDFRSHRPR